MPPAAAPIAVIGGGPAGLMAAEVLARAGLAVTVFDAMPSCGRKFLLAGRGGLNLTHSEALETFLDRYGSRRQALEASIRAFDPQALRDWVHGLGIDSFVGSSGRVFPREMKAAPLLRAWLSRLRRLGVRFALRHRWLGWESGAALSPSAPGAPTLLRFATPEGERQLPAAATLLALGGASWARFGSDGAWLPWLREAGLKAQAFRPANCGFDVGCDATERTRTGWSEYFSTRFRGTPVKTLAARCVDQHGQVHTGRGECMISASGIEGGLIYALSAALRDCIAASGEAVLELDLAPGRDLAQLQHALARPRGARSFASHLQSQTGIKGVKAGLLREVLPPAALQDPARLAQAIKSLPLRLLATRPLDEAISCAGGLHCDDLGPNFVRHLRPGDFAAGEMLDWEAPTGGYLLTACLATGKAAAEGLLRWHASSMPCSAAPTPTPDQPAA